MTRTVGVEHLARVEGHGGFVVAYDDQGVVTRSEFQITEGMRLLEGLLRGRRFEEIAPLVSRICAICSVAHTLASLRATEQAFGVVPGPDAERVRDLLMLGESIQSHALHIVFLALPDYDGCADVIEFARDHRHVVDAGLRVKKLGNTLQELLGGRAIHPVTPCVGGFHAMPTLEAMLRLRQELEAVRTDVGAIADAMAALPRQNGDGGLGAFAALRTRERRYDSGDAVGVLHGEVLRTVPVGDYRALLGEHTVPHAHAKHSRVDGESVMVGALARLMVNRDQDRAGVAAAAEAVGLSLPSVDPMDNNRAQAVELVLDLERATALVATLLDTAPSTEPLPPVQPRAGIGIGAVEAPRGLLIHEYEYDETGRLRHANVVTPTAINAASIEDHLRHVAEVDIAGPTRHAPGVIGAHRSRSDDRRLRQRLEMVVRAYDPCISCSVHVLRRGDEP